MKNFNQFILTLLAAGLFASCSLTEEPTSFVNRKSFYKNESQCIAALNSCYMPANAIYTANFMLVTEACTDIWYSSSTTVDACLDVTPAKPQYGKNVWTQGYKGVMYCNECVECISSADLADGVKMPLAAEARVMRAFYYYVLTCMFGDVPFYTTMVDTDQRLAEIRRLPRTPAHEIRQELYDDLERNALPWFTAENGRKCRASEAVDNRSGYALALMLMAKFAMWNEDWNGALVPLQALEELYGDFNEGNYPLAETQWRYKNPAESIFEIQHAWSLTGTQYNGNVAAIMMPTHNGDGVFDGVPLKGYGTSMPGWSSLRANNRYAIFRPATGNTQTENAAYVDALFNPLPLTYDTYDATLNRYTVKIDREALAAGEIRGQKIDRRVHEAADFVGLDPALLERSPFELSGGQKRRVAVAGVMAMKPRILVLDEPAAGLDPEGRDDILSEVKEYHKKTGTTVLLVSHSMEDIAKYANRVLVMSNKKIAMYDTVEKVFARAPELLELGLSVPQVTKIFLKLREMGVDVPADVYTIPYAVKMILEAKRRREAGESLVLPREAKKKGGAAGC